MLLRLRSTVVLPALVSDASSSRAYVAYTYMENSMLTLAGGFLAGTMDAASQLVRLLGSSGLQMT